MHCGRYGCVLVVCGEILSAGEISTMTFQALCFVLYVSSCGVWAAMCAVMHVPTTTYRYYLFVHMHCACCMLFTSQVHRVLCVSSSRRYHPVTNWFPSA